MSQSYKVYSICVLLLNDVILLAKSALKMQFMYFVFDRELSHAVQRIHCYFEWHFFFKYEGIVSCLFSIVRKSLVLLTKSAMYVHTYFFFDCKLTQAVQRITLLSRQTFQELFFSNLKVFVFYCMLIIF